MKRLFLTFAAMLLVSVGAFAQSGETPLKGDVNEDGVVDVADINAVIAIMKNGGGIGGDTKYYWYVGTNVSDSYLNAENFKLVQGVQQVTSYPESTEMLIKPGVEEFIYVVAKADKNVDVLTPNGLGMKIFNASENKFVNGRPENYVDGYAIYRSRGTFDEDVRVTVIGDPLSTPAYWFCGANASDSYIDASNYNTVPGISQVTSYPETTILSLHNEYLYVVVKSDMEVLFEDTSGSYVTMRTFDPSKGIFTKGSFTQTADGYAIYRSASEMGAGHFTVKVTDK